MPWSWILPLFCQNRSLTSISGLYPLSQPLCMSVECLRTTPSGSRLQSSPGLICRSEFFLLITFHLGGTFLCSEILHLKSHRSNKLFFTEYTAPQYFIFRVNRSGEDHTAPGTSQVSCAVLGVLEQMLSSGPLLAMSFNTCESRKALWSEENTGVILGAQLWYCLLQEIVSLHLDLG